MPDEDLSFDDLVRGPITFAAGSFPDFVVVRPGGQPLYTLVNPVDDALMRVTDVLRGEDLLPSTPRQIALYHALIDIGVASWVPRFGHMPLVLGDGTKKLSKRDPESNLFLHRERGFIPEGLLNYLALLGWSIGPDRDVFSQAELAAAFDIRNVNPNPARFDLKKAESINGDHIRMLDVDDLAARIVPYLQVKDVLPAEPSAEQLAPAARARRPLVQERMQLLGQAPDLLGSFFITADALVAGRGRASPACRGTPPRCSPRRRWRSRRSTDWTVDGVKAALERALIDEPRPQAARRVQPGAGRDERAARVAAAVRVARDPRQRRVASPASAGCAAPSRPRRERRA